jgi:ABC-type multidrug transport system fused ATPase/permease subunit
MILVTKQKILSDCKINFQIVVYSILTAVSAFFMIFPFAFSKDININTIFLFVVLLALVGIPFGYVFGLKNLIRTIKERNAFINDSISISVDRITDLYANCNQTSSESRAYQLTLEHYSRRTKKNVCVPTLNEFRKLREGDRCILVFCKGNKEPVAIYPGNEYVIDKSLTDKIVDF